MNSPSYYTELLSSQIPDQAIDKISQLLCDYQIELKVSKPRASKLGDYRHPYKNKSHRISININLNSYEFLLTLIHEVAHAEVWVKHKTKVRAHGKEWQQAYQSLLEKFISSGVFPDDLVMALSQSIKKSKATGTAEYNIKRVLRKYDEKNNNKELLEELQELGHFKLSKHRFQKLEKRRTRYRCRNTETGKHYLVSGVAEVEPLPMAGEE